METKKTAVDWLKYKVEDHFCLLPVDLIEEAKRIEKEQILEALNYDCYRNEYPENYYEERYGKKES